MKEKQKTGLIKRNKQKRGKFFFLMSFEIISIRTTDVYGFRKTGFAQTYENTLAMAKLANYIGN